MKKRTYISILFFLFFFYQHSIISGADIRRIHMFPRCIAMGDACTATADGKETIAYNPAGLLQKDVEWSLTVPIFGIAYNSIVKDMMSQTSDVDFGDQSSLDELPGKRIYIGLQTPFLPHHIFVPDRGYYLGFALNGWIELIFPPQTIIPTVDLNIVEQTALEYGRAFEALGLTFGYTIKLAGRIGAEASIDLLSVSTTLDDRDTDALIEEYGEDEVQPRLVMDFGVMYRFDHALNPRIAFSSMDVFSIDLNGDKGVKYGGIDYGNAGEVTQLNTVGFAMTKEIRRFYLTGSIDFQDYTFSYFSNNSIKRRIALGFEGAYGKKADNSHVLAIQLGLKELQYPSVGLTTRLGIVEFSTIQWTENFGTEETEILDKRYMLAISFVF